MKGATNKMAGKCVTLVKHNSQAVSNTGFGIKLP